MFFWLLSLVLKVRNIKQVLLISFPEKRNLFSVREDWRWEAGHCTWFRLPFYGPAQTGYFIGRSRLRRCPSVWPSPARRLSSSILFHGFVSRRNLCYSKYMYFEPEHSRYCACFASKVHETCNNYVMRCFSFPAGRNRSMHGRGSADDDRIRHGIRWRCRQWLVQLPVRGAVVNWLSHIFGRTNGIVFFRLFFVKYFT